jgi:predicted protein tyrosine phosphatase
MKILFLCTSNIHRSKTAEDYYKDLDKSNDYKSAGLNERNCIRFGSQVCTEELLEWADRVFVMEQKHIERIKMYTEEKYIHKVINLEIDDDYGYMDSNLIKIIIDKTRNYI